MKLKSTVLAGLVLVVLTGCVPMPPEIPTDIAATPTASEQADRQKPIRTVEPTEESSPTPTEEQPASESPTPTSEAADPELTVSQENAIESAKDYLAFIAFSREGLIEQLEYEKFTTEEATFAVDSLNVDWNEQAEKKAQEYMDAMSFSAAELQTQLEFEGFTAEQVAAGLAAVGY